MTSMRGAARESFMENSTERADQIVRVDASALLKTIRELEYKLTEQTRTDKPPPWVQALEERIAQLENNFYQNQSKLEPTEEGVAAQQPAGTQPTAAVAEGDPSAPAATEAPRSQSPTKGGEHKEGEKRSVVDLATEMRVIGKVRKEMDHKFHTAEVHMDTKISSFNLQLERLMKLLQIRPTTSELQTVMNAVYDVDKKVASSMEEIKNDMRTALKTNLSEEITSIIEEVKQSNNLSESGIKYMQQTVDGFAASLTDVREVTENTVVLMNEAMEKLQNHNSDLEDHIAKLKFQMDKQMQAQAGELAALKADHAVLFEEFTEYRNRTDEESARLAMVAAEEKMKFEEEIARLDYALSESDARIQANAVYIQTLESKAEASLAEQAQKNKAVTDTLAEYAFKLERLRKDADTLIAHDTPAKVLDLQEEIKKSNINIATCSEAIEKYVNGDLKQLNVKVAILQEQCNIQIPSAYGEMLVRIETLNEQLVSTNGALEKTQMRLQGTDDTVGELMPLVDRMTAVEVHSKDHVNELTSLKESLTNTIDTTDELIRRLEEAEEIVEGLENSVTNRMNQMRDALIDTVLEKQSETNNAVRNVRENLEVMARTGDGPVSASAVSQLTAPGARQSQNMSSGVSSKNSVSSMSSKNPPVSVMVPGQSSSSFASMAAPQPAAQPAASFAPSAQSSKANTASSRKQSGQGLQQGGGPGQGMRASISADVSEYGNDEFGDGFNSNVSLNSQANADMNVAAMQKSAVAAYQRPSMANQELRGSAPPMITRQASMSSVAAPAVMSRQPSNKFSNSESAPTLAVQMPQPRLSGYNSPSPGPQSAYQNFDLDASPEPNEYSRTIQAGNNSASYEQSPRTSTAQSSQRPSSSQPAMYQPQPIAVAVTPAVNNNYTAQPARQVQAPTAQGQVKYVPPPGQQAQRFQQHAMYQQQAGVMDGVDTMDEHYVPVDYQHFQQAQFLADLCLNFEEISVKRKRVANVPTVMCETIADITQDIAEYMAKAADYEMVQYMLSSVAGITSAQEISYDENIVLNKRTDKIEEYLSAVMNFIILTTKSQQPGMVRMDARSLFVSLVKKSLDMFMSKHNQVLVVGNSRLGRVKIPSCLACDRPLIDKVRLDSAASRGGNRGELGAHSLTSNANPSAHLITGLNGFSNNPSMASASFGFGAVPEGGGSYLRGGESEEDEPPATPTTLVPINQKKPGSALPAANNRKRSVQDGKLPEVQ